MQTGIYKILHDDAAYNRVTVEFPRPDDAVNYADIARAGLLLAGVSPERM